MIRAHHKATPRAGTSAGVTLSAMMLLPAGLVTTDARADVFNIEIDYMVDGGIGGHSNRPNGVEIDAVVQMFACQGHTLNVVVVDAIPHNTQLRNDPDNCRNTFDYSGANGSFGRLKQDYFDHAGESGWHYCIFAHFIEDGKCQVSGASGVAEIGGDDFIVSLGDFDGDIGTPWDRAATVRMPYVSHRERADVLSPARPSVTPCLPQHGTRRSSTSHRARPRCEGQNQENYR